MSENEWVDENGLVVFNETDVASNEISAALRHTPEVAALVRWGQQMQRRQGGIFERDKYVSPESPYDQMRIAYDAARDDDVVAGVIEMSEALSFGRLDFDADNEDDENILQQIATDADLANHMRCMWRELFTVSQAYVAVWWGKKDYKVKGKSEGGKKRKKVYSGLNVPVGMSLLDPLKVVPVGNFMFGQEKLAYIASDDLEVDTINDVLAGNNSSDLVVDRIIDRKYTPSDREKSIFANIDVDPERLFLLDPENVWRVTDTRSSYERFANIRMRSVFELLDLKRQLREMDRAHLIGGTNFIILVKKGTDELPAKPTEVRQLAQQVQASARIPLIVGDHRLSIEIITPKNDQTLQPDRYNGLDARITARLFGMFMTGNFAAGAKGDDSIKLARVIARGFETRRAKLVETINRELVKQIMERNADKFESDDANLEFHPQRIALDFDPAMAMMIQDLRDRGDLSREYTLDQLGADQETEAKRRTREKDKGYDDIFMPVQVPFDSPNKLSNNTTGDPSTEGRRQGGNKNGGGSNPDSTAPNSSPARPRKPAGGN